jgi:hypothetical protein
MSSVRKAVAIIVALGAMTAGGTGVAAEAVPSVEEIVHHANLMSYFQGRDGRAQVAMEITDSQGRIRKRQMTILRRDEPETDAVENGAYIGDQKYYVYFHRPADVNKMALIVWKHQGAADDRWLYLPALDLVRRIAASDERTSFAGSDFFYEDVSGRDIDADEHELVDVTDNYYVLRNRPKEPGTVEFSYYDTYVHKETFLPVLTEYYDRTGAKVRVYKALEVETIDGYPTVTIGSMTSLATGSTTVLSSSDVGYDIGLPESIFTERYLRRAPMEYLR